jgi:hypothetical protein
MFLVGNPIQPQKIALNPIDASNPMPNLLMGLIGVGHVYVHSQLTQIVTPQALQDSCPPSLEVCM